jgi:FkbM family methyltransferase
LNGCHVKAYEADPDTYAVLTDMLYRNRLIPRVDPVNAAIWTHTGFCPFEGRSYTSDIAHGRNGAVQVLGAGPNGNGDMTPGLPWGNTKNADSSPMIPCISFELALGSQRWDFVKMDIEGAEFQVLLATPERSLRNIDFLQVEFHNGWADDVIYNSVIEKLENIFDSRGPSENGRFHHAQFRRRLP